MFTKENENNKNKEILVFYIQLSPTCSEGTSKDIYIYIYMEHMLLPHKKTSYYFNTAFSSILLFKLIQILMHRFITKTFLM